MDGTDTGETAQDDSDPLIEGNSVFVDTLSRFFCS